MHYIIVIKKLISKIEQDVQDNVIPVSTGIYTQQKLVNHLQQIPKPLLVDYDDRIFYQVVQKQGTCQISSCPICMQQFNTRKKPAMCHFCTKWACEECMCHRQRLNPLDNNPNGKRYPICYQCDGKYLNLQMNHPYVENRTLIQTAIVDVSKQLQQLQQRLEIQNRKVDAKITQPKRKLAMKQSILKKQELDTKKNIKKINWEVENEKNKSGKLQQKLLAEKNRLQALKQKKQKQSIQIKKQRKQEEDRKIEQLRAKEMEQQRKIEEQMQRERQEKEREEAERKQREKQRERLSLLESQLLRQKQKEKRRQKQREIEIQKQKQRERERQRQRQKEKERQRQRQQQRQKQAIRQRQIQKQKQLQRQKQEQKKRQAEIQRQKEVERLRQIERKKEAQRQAEIQKLKQEVKRKQEEHQQQIQRLQKQRHQTLEHQLSQTTKTDQNTTAQTSNNRNSYLYNQFKTYFTEDSLASVNKEEHFENEQSNQNESMSRDRAISQQQKDQLFTKFRRSLDEEENKAVESEELEVAKMEILKQANKKRREWENMNQDDEEPVVVNTGQKCKCMIF